MLAPLYRAEGPTCDLWERTSEPEKNQEGKDWRAENNRVTIALHSETSKGGPEHPTEPLPDILAKPRTRASELSWIELWEIDPGNCVDPKSNTTEGEECEETYTGARPTCEKSPRECPKAHDSN